MHLDPLSLFTSALAVAGLAAAVPVGVPTDNGFPNPNAQQLLDIERIASGRLSNAPPPDKLEPSTLVAFQLIAYNEQVETAYFKSLINNITTNVPGFELDNKAKKAELLDTLKIIQAQEELHALTARGILQHFGAFVPEPCQYAFPTTDIRGAIALIQTVTSFVMGTLQDAEQLMAKNGDDGPVRSIASVIGQEGEQNGYFRTLLGRVPSEKPFMTTSLAAYAWSALQGFTVPGTCPFPLTNIALPIFKPLSVLGGDVGAHDQLLTFTADLTDAAKYVGGNGSGLFVTYLTGQQLPISEPVQNVRWNGKQATFEAFFPYTENIMDGLTVAGLTTASNFAGPDDMPAATVAAPALIQVNRKVSAWDGNDI
ncbi:hypothetical protein GE09DRAFT_1046995 [Coniochaeta sp. 2T2.1]|nr:hypothetical protein GE09DRAFT_1046995 [Coniochaeta sp. 2T2.1]